MVNKSIQQTIEENKRLNEAKSEIIKLQNRQWNITTNREEHYNIVEEFKESRFV